MTVIACVDETKAKGYVICVAWVSEGAVSPSRAAIRHLVLSGQRSVHMRTEKDSRRRLICSTIVSLAQQGLRLTMYDAGRRYATDRDARRECLQQVLEEASRRQPVRLLLDRDQSLVSWDKQLCIRWLRKSGITGIEYEHRSLHEESLLTIPDAGAWCYARGGTWRGRLEPVIDAVHLV